MTDQSPTLFLVGPGYSASRLAALCLDTGAWRVVGTARSEDKAAALREKGIEPVLTNDRDGLSQAAKASHWVISTPPGDEGCPGFGLVGDFAREAASVTYLSTTGVYGDLDGGWAFEWSPVNPGTKRGERRVLAEQQWLSVRRDTRLVRLPGIYGPGRSALERVREGTARRIVKPGHVFSRIHVADIARGLFLLMKNERADGVFHFTDDEPAPPQDVIAEAARLLGLPAPPEVPFALAGLSPMAQSFYAECKRVSNARAKAALGWHPAYPGYREGLAAILAAETSE